MHAPVVSDIVEQIQHAYNDDLPGLPYPELPVVALSGEFAASACVLAFVMLNILDLSGATSALLSEVMHALSEDKDAEDGVDEAPSLQVHLYPAECSSVMSMMKAIVTGFVDRNGESSTRPVPCYKHQFLFVESGKRKPTSLASFDINLLRAWYDAQEVQPRLIVFLHDFEKFDTNVVQDAFYICRQVAPPPFV